MLPESMPVNSLRDGEPVHIVAIHGFNINDGGAQTTDTIEPFIENAGWTFDKDEADYGYLGLFKILLFNGKARSDVLIRIAGAIYHADIIYAHSNGVNFLYQALDLLPEEMRNTKVIVCISGAVNANREIPDAVKAQLVLYTPWDIWVRLSSYLPFNLWGRQGAIGYKGTSKRNTNIKDKSIREHSAWWKRSKRFKTWKYIYNFGMENF